MFVTKELLCPRNDNSGLLRKGGCRSNEVILLHVITELAKVK